MEDATNEHQGQTSSRTPVRHIGNGGAQDGADSKQAYTQGRAGDADHQHRPPPKMVTQGESITGVSKNWNMA